MSSSSEESNGEHDNNNNSKSQIVLRVASGSSNPAKIRAVEQALRHATNFDIDIQGFSVESGVPDQPFGNDETRQGAKNRAERAYHAYRAANQKPPHLAIGMEGGLELSYSENFGDESIYCMAWMAIYGRREAVTVDAFACADTKVYVGDKKPIFGLAKTSLFPIPDEMAKLVKQGVELGHASNQVFDSVQSKQGSGAVGLLTDGLIDRSAYYEHAILLALIPWIRPHFYPEGNK